MSLQRRGIARREFLKGTAATVAGVALGSRLERLLGAAVGGEKRPNILWVMSDEHNPRVAGCYGNKLARTPNIDGLAERGVAFDGAYCNSPLCVPSRSSLTAGKYCSRVSVWGNDCELPGEDIVSLPRLMNEAGYESYLCGKQHYDYSRRYGFTQIGGNFNNNYKTGHGGRRNPDDLEKKPLSPRFDDFHTGDSGGSVVHDRKVTAGAVKFLGERAAGEKPFFLFTGFLSPHYPLIVPEEYWKHFEGKVEMPTIPEGHLDRLALNYKHLRAAFRIMETPADKVRAGRELYYGLTEWVDNEIGKVLAAMRGNSAIAENTVVIYSSDHGENMGEHGLWWKNAMYEHAARIPLIVSWPGRWAGGQRRTQACSLLDVVNTVLEIGGAKRPEDWNGDSMVKWIDDGKSAWKDLAVSEYYAHNIASGFVMARSGKWKYTYHTTMDEKHPAERELYDLSSDPGEFTNVAGREENAAVVKQMHERMVKEIGEDPEESERRSRRELAKGYDRKDGPPGGKKKAGEA